MVYLDVLRFALTALWSMLISPGRLARRSWRAEYFCRFLNKLMDQSRDKSLPWLRERQGCLKLKSPLQKQVVCENQTIEGVPCQWCRPASISQPERIVIYCHGGGYVVGEVDGYHNTLAHIAIESNAWVVAMDYRLGPEHSFPAAQDDCLAVTRHILAEYPDIPVFMAGDSAGGGLAVATALSLTQPSLEQSSLQQQAGPQLSGLALISPWLEPTGNSASMQSNVGSDMFDRELLMRWIELYMSGTDLRHPRVDFSQCDLSLLPPVYIQAGGAEILIDQIRAFAERAQAAGIKLQLDVFEDQFHVFQIFVPVLPDSQKALKMLGEFIKSQNIAV